LYNFTYSAQAATADDDRRHLEAEFVLKISSPERTNERAASHADKLRTSRTISSQPASPLPETQVPYSTVTCDPADHRQTDTPTDRETDRQIRSSQY